MNSSLFSFENYTNLFVDDIKKILDEPEKKKSEKKESGEEELEKKMMKFNQIMSERQPTWQILPKKNDIKIYIAHNKKWLLDIEIIDKLSKQLMNIIAEDNKKTFQFSIVEENNKKNCDVVMFCNDMGNTRCFHDLSINGETITGFDVGINRLIDIFNNNWDETWMKQKVLLFCEFLLIYPSKSDEMIPSLESIPGFSSKKSKLLNIPYFLFSYSDETKCEIDKSKITVNSTVKFLQMLDHL